MAELDDWDIAAANNNDAPPDGFPENMNYSAVNNAAREVMAVLARFWKDSNGELQLAGPVNAYTLTLNAGYTALFQGMRFAAEVNITNTGATTLAVNALAATTVVNTDGSALTGGELQAGGVYDFVYDGTNFQLFNPSVQGWAGQNAGMVEDIQALADPNTDTLLGWDDSAGAVIGFGTDESTGLQISGTDVVFNASLLTNETAMAAGDELPFYDASAGAMRVITWAALETALEGVLEHDQLQGFVASEHDDHDAISITAGLGLSGGGTIGATRTIDLDLGSLTANSGIAGADSLAFDDDSLSTVRRITYTNFIADIEATALHDNFSDYVINEHINHNNVDVIAGDGLNGGGAITADRTLNMDHQTVAAVKTANTDRTNATITADPHLTVSLGTGRWAFQAYIYARATVGATDFSFDFNFTGTDSGGRLTYMSPSTTGLNTFDTHTSLGEDSIDHAIGSTADDHGFVITGMFEATTSGTLQFRWAQGTTDAGNPTRVNINSWLVATRVS